MRLLPRGVFRRCLAVLAAVSFAATSPGLAGFEVVAHLTGLVDLTHQRQPHFEGAGQSGHTDECQLGTAAFGVRLPTLGAPTLRLLAERAPEPWSAGSFVPFPAPHETSLPRAPPA
ncbi:MAG TPA: hypothetical protein VJU15_16440 [Gemmatimonadales bacterium]|nr:hypothetical protein [Gemmatimonadales bacterium]